MLCLTSLPNGLYQVASNQPLEYTTCINILATSQELAINAYALTASQGLQIASAIGILWATAFAFRTVGQFLNNLSNQSKE